MDFKKIDEDTQRYIIENIGYFLLPVFLLLTVFFGVMDNFWGAIYSALGLFFVWGFQFGMIFKEMII